MDKKALEIKESDGEIECMEFMRQMLGKIFIQIHLNQFWKVFSGSMNMFWWKV